jgi:hypothetical protein
LCDYNDTTINLFLLEISTKRLEEDKKPPKEEQLETFAKLLKENGYSVKKLTKKL